MNLEQCLKKISYWTWKEFKKTNTMKIVKLNMLHDKNWIKWIPSQWTFTMHIYWNKRSSNDQMLSKEENRKKSSTSKFRLNNNDTPIILYLRFLLNKQSLSLKYHETGKVKQH